MNINQTITVFYAAYMHNCCITYLLSSFNWESVLSITPSTIHTI